jgi:hypothetical protein
MLFLRRILHDNIILRPRAVERFGVKWEGVCCEWHFRRHELRTGHALAALGFDGLVLAMWLLVLLIVT